jgi:hypothetical protein
MADLQKYRASELEKARTADLLRVLPICRSSSSTELSQWLSCGLTLKQKELWKLFTGDVWATGERCEWLHAETEKQTHQLGCFLFVNTQSLTVG